MFTSFWQGHCVASSGFEPNADDDFVFDLGHQLDERTDPYERWVQHCSQGLHTLISQREHSGPNGDFNGVSILSYQDCQNPNKRRVEIIQWADKELSLGTKGRVASLDSDNKVKAIVAVGAKRYPIDFQKLNPMIIWRDTGVRAVRAQWKKDQQQSTMKPHLLRVLDMFREAEGDSRRTEE